MTDSLGPRPLRNPDSADVVIYDGACRFCTAQMNLLARLDVGGRLAFLSLHDPVVASRYPDLSRAALMRQMYVVARDGRRFAGASAVRRLSRRLVALWLLAPLLHFPGTDSFWAWLYRSIARNRYWFGRIECDDACDIGRH